MRERIQQVWFPRAAPERLGEGWGSLNLRAESIHCSHTLLLLIPCSTLLPHSRRSIAAPIPKPKPSSKRVSRTPRYLDQSYGKPCRCIFIKRVITRPLNKRPSKVCVSTQEFLTSWSDLWLPGCPSCGSTQPICKGPGSASCNGHPGYSNGLGSPTSEQRKCSSTCGSLTL